MSPSQKMYQKLDRLEIKLTALDGKIDTLRELLATYNTSHKVLESRIWTGLGAVLLSLFGTVFALIRKN